MSNRRCPTCGEEYSDTYRSCPFCEEENAIKRGHPPRRRGGRRTEKRQPSSGGAGGVMLLLCVLVIVGVVGYVFFGEDIADTMGIRTDPSPSQTGLPPASDPTTPDNTAPDAPGEDAPSGDDLTIPEPDNQPPAPPPEPVPLTLNQSSITIRVGDKGRLDFTGGAGEVTWASSNPEIAAVEGGVITGVAGGTVTITASSGEEKAECQVKVEGDPWVDPNPSTYQLSKTDFTLSSSENSWQLKVKKDDGKWEIMGSAEGVTWASANTSIATISENGLVKRAGKGMTTITATVGGTTLECIVRMS